jgi:hypothetical protein
MKRYTDTEKWESRSFSNYSPYAKLAYLYILDRCDAVGVWKGNWNLLFFTRGATDQQGIKKELGVKSVKSYTGEEKFLELNDGKILVVNFLKYQFQGGLVSRKPMVVGAKSKAMESKELFEILVKINGKEFFGELTEGSSGSSSVGDPTCDNEDSEVIGEEKTAEEVGKDQQDCEKDGAECVVGSDVEEKPSKKQQPLAEGKKALKEILGDGQGFESCLEAFTEYLGMRVKKRKPMTDRGVRTLFNKLVGLNAKSIVAALNDATDGCWMSVYPKERPDMRTPEPPGNFFQESVSSGLRIDV